MPDPRPEAPPRAAPAPLLTLADYERDRDGLRRRALAHKQRRCVELGPSMRLQFEDRLTLQHQLHEVLRAERVEDPAERLREWAAYAALWPDGRSWCATLSIELPDAGQRRRELPLLNDAVHHVHLELPGRRRVWADVNADLPDRHRGRPSGVHFVRFELPPVLRRQLRAGVAAVLGCDHPQYRWRRVLPARVGESLLADLAPDPISSVETPRCTDPTTPLARPTAAATPA